MFASFSDMNNSTLEPELSVSADHENDMDVDITEPREGPELPSSSELEGGFTTLLCPTQG